jgi:predicted TIM-barrel fold metal-dependent hydrolase
MAKSNPVVAAVIGNLDPADESFRRNLEIFAKDRKYRGVRLNSDRLRNCLWKTEAIDRLRALEQRGLTVDMLGDGSTFLEDVLRFNDRLPQVKLVVDHLPFKDEKHVIKEFSGRGSVFAKLSGVPRRVNGQVPPGIDSYRETLDQLWQVFGEDRLVYASNWPVSNLVAPYREVLMVHQEYLETKNPAARQKYFRENSKLAYGWDDNG